MRYIAEIGAVQKNAHLVDLENDENIILLLRIYLQRSASIQLRTSPKYEYKLVTIFVFFIFGPGHLRHKRNITAARDQSVETIAEGLLNGIAEEIVALRVSSLPVQGPCRRTCWSAASARVRARNENQRGPKLSSVIIMVPLFGAEKAILHEVSIAEVPSTPCVLIVNPLLSPPRGAVASFHPPNPADRVLEKSVLLGGVLTVRQHPI